MFKIQTLSDKQNLGFIPDPGTIIALAQAGLQLITSIFGLGNKSKQLTQADWNTIFPFNGNTYNQYKNYMYNHIKWNSDLNNIPVFTLYASWDLGFNGNAGALLFELAKERYNAGVYQGYNFSLGVPPNYNFNDISNSDWKYVNNFNSFMSSPYYYDQSGNSVTSPIIPTPNINNTGGTGTGSTGGTNIIPPNKVNQSSFLSDTSSLSTLLLIGGGVFLVSQIMSKKNGR